MSDPARLRELQREELKQVNRFSMTIFAAMAAAGAMYAQAPQTEITVLKAAYTSIKTNITKAAERMPEADYGFKASPDIRTFGALIGHIADVQSRICSAASGVTPGTASAEKDLTKKADLVGALKASFDTCDAVFTGLSDDDAAKTMSLGRGAPRSKTATLWQYVVGHSNE